MDLHNAISKSLSITSTRNCFANLMWDPSFSTDPLRDANFEKGLEKFIVFFHNEVILTE